MTYSILPSLPADSFQQLQSVSDAVRGVSTGLQIDLVDGTFAPHTSWPFTEADPQAALLHIMQLGVDFEIELDCMVMQPEQYLDLFVQLHVPRVIIHVGSTDVYSQVVRHAHDNHYQIGFAFTNDIPLSFIYPYIDQIDFVQIMGIAQVGAQGQPFDTRTLTTARTLRDAYPDLQIAVDGSVNETTIPQLLQAGVDRFAPGSAISTATDPAAAYKHLKSLLPE